MLPCRCKTRVLTRYQDSIIESMEQAEKIVGSAEREKQPAAHILMRLVKINAALWGYLLWWACVRANFIRPRKTPAARFAAMLESLSTTFVKLGQGLSVHSEFLPDSYIAALQKLQDKVVPFPSDIAKAEIEASLGKPVFEAFAEFDEVPMAAGSVAQVHRAVLLSGREVIVKVRRPGILRMVDEDVRILKFFARSVLLVLPRFERFDPLGLVDELSRNLRKEIAFRQEGANISRFMEVFKGSEIVYIPAVVKEFTSDWVLVQEFSHGRKIDSTVLRADGPRLAKNLVDAYVHQFFVAGVFHGDPHPGNVFVLSDGRICLHDFGLVGFLNKATRANLVAFMQAFVQQDGEWLLDASLDLGLLGGAVDRSVFRSGLEELIQDYTQMPLRDWSFGEAFIRIARMGKGQNMRIPHHLLVLLRAVFLMENTVRKLDPEFNLLEGLFAKAAETFKAVSQPALPELAARLKYESLLALAEMPQGLGKIVHRIRAEGLSVTFHHAGLKEMQKEVRQTGVRVSLALLALGLYVAASLLMQHSLGPTIGGIPILAAAGYALALWTTVKVLLSISRPE